MRGATSLALIFFLVIIGCGGAEEPVPTPPVEVELDPNDPTILVRPFSAEEIRDDWVPGFRLMMRRSFPEQTVIERWTVVNADDEGVEIEYATISDDGSVMGEPTTKRSTWIELRDHASFPADHASREWISRSTALGDFEGWLYRVADSEAATIREFFFVPELPGAPVQMRILEGETTVFELEQTARLRPEVDPTDAPGE
jgi:hypothetical protein